MHVQHLLLSRERLLSIQRANAFRATPAGDVPRGLMRIAGVPLEQPVAESVAFAVICPLLLLPAVWNGFPFIFYDTGAYLLEGLGRVFMAERSPVYSLFLAWSGAAWSLWLVALVQSAIVSFTIVETARAVVPRIGVGILLAIAAGLIVATGLPWVAGEIEPDCFAAPCVLALYLLSFQAEALRGWRGYAIAAVAGLSIGIHPSHLLLGCALTAALLLCRFVARNDGQRPRLLPAALSCCLGLGLIVAGNYALVGSVFVSRAGPAFLFARLLQDGIVVRLLDDTCPQSHYRLCADKEMLPRTADQWLWNKSSPFFAMGRFTGTSAESSRIIADSVVRYPALQVESAALDTVRQFAKFRTGDQIEPQEWVEDHAFQQFLPRQRAAYLAASQQRGKLDFRPINRVDVPVGWLSLAALVWGIAAAARHGDRRQTAFLGFVALGLFANAAICGTISNPHDRYQSRLLWLAPFATLLIVGDGPKLALRGVGESGT